ncbi:PepSY-associated TM helix domain-containing protein [Flagellimonas aequoris]|uniref:PepSY domain-containing protein n=1 Tax=Flagellimonas aequoris TaxID=2306997 RepID=A0A418N9N1_9FLAO|nr:PepSY-associated TM helix domain-containing protein [Allomuricauda aequoris]RIV72115.1 PepSY domain-containing protein [Allomuricauda aequoris]TXK03888.1 PepSY domain-containing protein [Allomuricauda aequoris]
MGNRIYNILFHTHTVSGIVISVALYVIFFTGSFSFFRDEIANWQRGHEVSQEDAIPGSVDQYLKDLSENYNLRGRDVELRHYFNERNISVSLSASKDSLATEKDKVGAFFYMDTEDKTTSDYRGSYHLGEFLYRLHFLDQIPYPYGRYLAGLVAFFFLFAIITGILVHWDKIVSNFYTFRPWAKLKTVWTDAHTALGVIGFPFQFVYAVTGAFFLLKGILILPIVMGLYDGDQNKLYEDLEYNHPIYAYQNEKLERPIPIDNLVDEVKEDWPDFRLTEAHIFNYGDTNMHVSISGHLGYGSKFSGAGYRIYKIGDGSLVEEKVPMTNNSYLDGVKNIMFRLHFGDYAGYGLRVISFILGLISCFVILSGILIWLVARDKKNIPEKRRKFNHQVANIYMAICLTMYPVTALEFIIVKFAQHVDMAFLYRTYFPIWLVATLFFVFKKNISFTNKWTLISGGILALLIPITNGLVSGNWLWTAYRNGQEQILLVDLLWLVLGMVTLWIAFFKLKTKQTEFVPSKS